MQAVKIYLFFAKMMTYQYPKATDIYPDRGKKSYRLKRLRFNLRSRLHFTNIRKFTQFANQHPELHSLLKARPNYSYPLVHRFLDKRFSSQQRLNAICDNLIFLPEKLTACGLPALWEKPVLLGSIDDEFDIYLNINEHQPMEGYWALELRQKSTNQLIYLLTFGKVNHALLIAVVQGANTENAKDVVKQLTKQCHGLRPAYLMVEVMKALTKTLGYDTLCGIPHKYQNKSRFVQSKRYVVDYDAIFRESGGILQDYWHLPLELDTNLDDVPSKKRSMYRKRFAMLEQLAQQIDSLFSR